MCYALIFALGIMAIVCASLVMVIYCGSHGNSLINHENTSSHSKYTRRLLEKANLSDTEVQAPRTGHAPRKKKI